MAVIYMKHEFHGEKVACSEEEAQADEKRGWKRFTVKGPKLDDPQKEAERQARMSREEEQSMVVWKAKQAEEKRQQGGRSKPRV